jgi:predicted transposase/invertase (TIGR01784 family)
MALSEKYLDPFTDFGFKKLFGTETNKDLLIDFLNELLRGKKSIRDLTYSKNEHLGKTPVTRKAVFDLYCESANGEKFIIELQKVKQQYFKDRSLYYSTFPIQDQATGEQWNYRLPEIFTIGIMDFSFDNTHPGQFRHEVKLTELTSGEVFYDKLTFIFMEMPKFTKKEDELETHFDKWMYLLKHLSKLQDIPAALLLEPVLLKALKVAEVSNLNKEDMNAYEASLKDKRDWKNALDTAIEEALEKGIEKGMEKGIEKGMEKGIEKGVEKIARQMKKEGFPNETIAKITGLPTDKIEKL